MRNQNRDSAGKYSSAGSNAPNPNEIQTPTTTGALLSATTTSRPPKKASALPPTPEPLMPPVGRGFDDVMRASPGGSGGGGLDSTQSRLNEIIDQDNASGLRATGHLGTNEHAGDLTVNTSQGPAYHGSDIPGAGIPGPADIAEAL